jgi:UTP--glucose-1-phosphate uridylyltransferase
MERLLETEEMYALVVDPAEGCDTGTPAAWAATNARMTLRSDTHRAAFLEELGDAARELAL